MPFGQRGRRRLDLAGIARARRQTALHQRDLGVQVVESPSEMGVGRLGVADSQEACAPTGHGYAPSNVESQWLAEHRYSARSRVLSSEEIGPGDAAPVRFSGPRDCQVSPPKCVQIGRRPASDAGGVGFRRGWDSKPTRPFRFCKLQILHCRRCRECQRCRGALHPIAPTAEPRLRPLPGS